MRFKLELRRFKSEERLSCLSLSLYNFFRILFEILLKYMIECFLNLSLVTNCMCTAESAWVY